MRTKREQEAKWNVPRTMAGSAYSLLDRLWPAIAAAIVVVIVVWFLL
jgi:hypothetical protein